MYMAYYIILEVTYNSNPALFFGIIDLMIVTIIAFLLALFLVKKDEDFFEEEPSPEKL